MQKETYVTPLQDKFYFTLKFKTIDILYLQNYSSIISPNLISNALPKI